MEPQDAETFQRQYEGLKQTDWMAYVQKVWELISKQKHHLLVDVLFLFEADQSKDFLIRTAEADFNKCPHWFDCLIDAQFEQEGKDPAQRQLAPVEALKLFDRRRLLKALSGVNLGFAFYEILKHPSLLKDSVIESRQLPGFYALLLNSEESISRWAREQIKRLGKISEVGAVSPLLPVLTDIFELKSKAHWTACCLTLENFQQEVFQETVLGIYFPDLVDRIFEHFLRDDAQELIQALRTFWALVKLLGVRVWLHSEHSPGFVIEKVIDATTRLAQKRDAQHTRACFLLLAEILKSLENMEGDELHKRTGLVLDFLLEDMQGQDYTKEIRTSAGLGALKIVSRRYSFGDLTVPMRAPWPRFLDTLSKKDADQLVGHVVSVEALSLRFKCLVALGKDEERNSRPLIWTPDFWTFVFTRPTNDVELFRTILSSFEFLGLLDPDAQKSQLRSLISTYLEQVSGYLTSTLRDVFSSKDCVQSFESVKAFTFLLASPAQTAASQFLRAVTNTSSAKQAMKLVCRDKSSWLSDSILSVLTEVTTLTVANCFPSLEGLYNHAARLFLDTPELVEQSSTDRSQILELLWKISRHLVTKGTRYKEQVKFESVMAASFRAFVDLWPLWVAADFLDVFQHQDEWIPEFFQWFRFPVKITGPWFESLMCVVESIPKGKMDQHKVLRIGITKLTQQSKFDVDKKSRLQKAMLSADHAMPPPQLPKYRQPDLRPDCVYGFHCSERKLEHFMNFSHPDALLRRLPPSYRNLGPAQTTRKHPEVVDLDEPQKCPYGLGCKRTDSKHLSEFRHPPGFTPSLHSPDFVRRQPYAVTESFPYPGPDSFRSTSAPPKPKATSVQLLSPPVPKILRPPATKDSQVALAETQRLSVSELLKKVLLWTEDALSMNINLPPVPKTFEVVKQYLDVFQPLLLEELKAQILQEENRPITKAVVKKVQREDEFHFVDVKCDSNVGGFVDGDLVKFSSVTNSSAVCFGRFEIEHSEHDPRVRLYLPAGSSAGKAVQASLKLDTKWTLERRGSLITVLREYEALRSCQHIPLASQIMLPTTAVVFSNQPFHISSTLAERFTQEYNPSQIKAIEAATKAKGFGLIQGPPGTGKTRTILGVLSALMSAPFEQQRRYEMQNGRAVSRSNRTQILVCAPSNAAVDETVLRIRSGLWNAQGEVFVPNVVRHGSSTNPDVQPFTLDNLIEKRIKGVEEPDRHKLDDCDRRLQELMKRADAIRDSIAEWHEKREVARESGAHVEETKATAELTRLHSEKQAVAAKREQLRSERRGVSEHLGGSRRRLSLQLLSEANIICATLSGSGHHLFKGMHFPTVIIDEAAQAVEVSTLIPLCHGCIRAILIGDPNQLPATVLSRNAQNSSYQQSLFERLNLCGVRMHMLDVQYRMNPMISAFPAKFFYDNKLQNGPNTDVIQPYHTDELFGAFVAYGVSGQEQSSVTSLKNPTEARALCDTMKGLLAAYPVTTNQSIGVITPYKAQVRELKNQLRAAVGEEVAARITVNTVDGFQGAERDIIFFSCVRASVSGIGFLADTRRMNVGLTRARYLLAVFGNPDALSANVTWNAFFSHARQVGRFRQYQPTKEPVREKRKEAGPGGPAKRQKIPDSVTTSKQTVKGSAAERSILSPAASTPLRAPHTSKKQLGSTVDNSLPGRDLGRAPTAKLIILDEETKPANPLEDGEFVEL